MDNGLSERDWNLLIKRIGDGKCTPFIGSEFNKRYLPSRAALAASWAVEYGYPLPDNMDLSRVAQYLAVEYDPYFPKEEIQKQLQTTELPRFNEPNQPHALLANLQLPIYITTNYDDFMFAALAEQKMDPRRELCRWNPYLQRSQPSHLETDYKPTPANPLVYHLHGHFEAPESLVLTEDDYLDFLVNISSDEYALPARIQQALTDTSLLFVGFQPEDLDFRVLFRGLVTAAEEGLRRISVTVQLPALPNDSNPSAREKVQRYLDKYFDTADRQMRVYWGSTDQFMRELHQRWQGQARVNGQPETTAPALDLLRLQQNLTESFNLQELREMSQYEFRIDFETFSDTKPAFILELVTYMQRRGRLYELAETCQQLRPNLEWL